MNKRKMKILPEDFTLPTHIKPERCPIKNEYCFVSLDTGFYSICSYYNGIGSGTTVICALPNSVQFIKSEE